MSVKTYKTAWFLFTIAFGIAYLSGELSPLAGVVFGILAVALIFMGMMSVLPAELANRII